MSSRQQSAEQSPAVLALFAVCGDAEVSSLAAQMPELVSSVVYAGEFGEYITAARRPQFSQTVREAAASVALIDFDRDRAHALETAEILSRLSSPRVTCIGTSSHLDTDLLLRAMRAGCGEFLQKPVAAEKLQEVLERLQTRVATGLRSAAPGGRVLTLFGVKGGVGTSTLAVHLATFLAKQHGSKTLLIDHHHELGHACLYLGLKENTYHFDEVVRSVDRLDADLLGGFLVRHPSGLSVISSPDTRGARHRVTLSDMERIFTLLRQEYDFIIIDSSLRYEETAATIQLSDEIYLVATADIAALRDLTRHIEHLSLSGTAAGRLRIVINRSLSHNSIAVEKIEKAARLPVSITIPNSYAELLQAINAGEAISPQRRSEFTAQMSKWASQIVAQADRPSKVAAGPAPKRKLSFWR